MFDGIWITRDGTRLEVTAFIGYIGSDEKGFLHVITPEGNGVITMHDDLIRKLPEATDYPPK